MEGQNGRGKDVKFSWLYNSLTILHTSLFILLSGGFEKGKKEAGRGEWGILFLRRTLSAVPNTETDRGDKEITSTCQTRC